MRTETIDRLGIAALVLSVAYTGFAAMSWNWFPTPGDWGDIARIPKSMKNYVALLLPPVVTLVYLIVRRRIASSQ